MTSGTYSLVYTLEYTPSAEAVLNISSTETTILFIPALFLEFIYFLFIFYQLWKSFNWTLQHKQDAKRQMFKRLGITLAIAYLCSFIFLIIEMWVQGPIFASLFDLSFWFFRLTDLLFFLFPIDWFAFLFFSFDWFVFFFISDWLICFFFISDWLICFFFFNRVFAFLNFYFSFERKIIFLLSDIFIFILFFSFFFFFFFSPTNFFTFFFSL